MYKLETPIKINSDIYNNISALKDKMLITSESNLIMIRDYKIEKITEEKKERHLFKSSTLVTEVNDYITEIDIMGYNSELEYWGKYNGDNTIQTILTYFNLQRMRENYVKKIKRPLEKLGIDFTIKEETMEDNYCETCVHLGSQNYIKACGKCDGVSNYNQKNIKPCTVVFYTVGTFLLALTLIVLLNYHC
jgi:hypothetical protein